MADRIARNLVIDHFRAAPAAGAQTSVDGVPDSALPSTTGPEQDLGIAPELAAALACLGDREREIVALRFGADLTGQQIADLTGMTLANTQQVLSRTLRGLRVQLGQRPGVRDRTEGGDGEQQRPAASCPATSSRREPLRPPSAAALVVALGLD